MARFMPIPKSMLVYTIEVRLPDGIGGFNDGVVVEHVAVQMEQSVCADEHRSADAGAGVVFIDATHSKPAMDVPAGSRVVLGGQSYLVAKAARIEATHGRVHHWELTLR